MAGETSTPQAEQAGAVVEEAIASAETNAAVAIETAAAQVDAANETAVAIARAAEQSEIGRDVATLREDMVRWQNDQTSQLLALQEENQMIQSGLTEALNRIADGLTPRQPVITEVPVSTQTAPPPEELPPIAPASADAPQAAPTSPPAAPRKPLRRAI